MIRDSNPPRAFQLGAVLALVVVLFAGAARAQESRARNVLFLIADDLGAQALGFDGNAQARTPHIDALARRSMVFERAYCQYPVCGAARAALMSGMYPQANGVFGNGNANRFGELLGDRPSLADAFREAGHETVRLGKIYHMRVPGDITAGVHGPDHARSWTRRFSFQGPEWYTDGEAKNLGTQRIRLEQDVHYNLGFGTAFYEVRGNGDGSEQHDHQAATKAIELLGELRDRPFFLAVGFVRPHVPLVAPATYFEPFPAADMALPAAVADDRADIPQAGMSLHGERIGVVDAATQRRVLAAYAAATSYLDAQVGRVLAALEDLGLADDTVVVFTSDHGYHLGEHGFWQKMSLHEESARVPLLIAAPGRPAGRTGGLAQHVDLYPTLCELAGIAVPPHAQGRSLVPLLDDPGARVHDAVYCARGRRNATDHLLRTERFAYLRWRDGSEELYDMARDPRQFVNLADRADHAATRDDLRARLDALLEGITPR